MIINHNGINYKLPDVFIIGIQKSGTSTLFDYLTSQKGFYKSLTKEPHYFTPTSGPFHKIKKNSDFFEKKISTKGLKKYGDIYKKSKSTDLLVDASPHYFYQVEDFIQRVREIYGKKTQHLKIIVSFREPCSRLNSAFDLVNLLGLVDANLTFSDFMETSSTERNHLIEMSLYSDRFKKILNVFGPKNILVFTYDEFKNKEQDLIDKLSKFFGKTFSGQIPKSNVTMKFKNKYWKEIYCIFEKIKYLLKPVKWRLGGRLLNHLIAKFGRYEEKRNIDKNYKKYLIQKYFIEDLSKLSEMIDNKYIKEWIISDIE